MRFVARVGDSQGRAGQDLACQGCRLVVDPRGVEHRPEQPPGLEVLGHRRFDPGIVGCGTDAAVAGPLHPQRIGQADGRTVKQDDFGEPVQERPGDRLDGDPDPDPGLDTRWSRSAA